MSHDGKPVSVKAQDALLADAQSRLSSLSRQQHRVSGVFVQDLSFMCQFDLLCKAVPLLMKIFE